jgi:hypothetical protein
MRTSASGAFGDSGEDAPGLARRGAICGNSFVLIPLAATASFAGDKLAANYQCGYGCALMSPRPGKAKALTQEQMKAK